MSIFDPQSLKRIIDAQIEHDNKCENFKNEHGRYPTPDELHEPATPEQLQKAKKLRKILAQQQQAQQQLAASVEALIEDIEKNEPQTIHIFATFTFAKKARKETLKLTTALMKNACDRRISTQLISKASGKSLAKTKRVIRNKK